MTPRILWVDDEASLIQSMKRQLRNEFDISEAYSGDQALDILGKTKEAFCAIVSDQRMPGMDGIELLKLVKDIAPDSVRIMLTGYADQETAIEAVNQGQIFRFLTKPCLPHVMLRALRDAVRQYELVTAERELLENTLTGSIQVMVDILSLASPVAFRRASRVSGMTAQVGALLKVQNLWQLSSAAMLAHMGYITLPASVLENYYAARQLSPSEESMMLGQVESTARILSKIPRMEPVVRIISSFQNSRNTPAVQNRDPVSLCANILHSVIEYDRLITSGLSRSEALRRLSTRPAEFNADVLKALSEARPDGESGKRLMVMVDALKNGMIVDEDVRTSDGVLLVPKGYVINDTVRQRLRNFRLQDEIDASVAVICE